MKKYAIREISDLTGVKPVTLRAWQRRYSLIEPERTEKGHRLYSEQHLQRINDIQSWLNKGVSIGKVKSLLEGGESVQETMVASPLYLEDVESVLEALANLNKGRAETLIHSVMKEYPLNVVETQFIQPILNALSLVRQNLRSIPLGLFNTLMFNKLNSIIEAENKAAREGKCLFISFEGQADLGARLAALRLVEEGQNMTLIDGVDDLSGLVTHPRVREFSMISVYSDHSISDHQLGFIRQLHDTFSGKIILSDILRRLQG
ncbi:MerR family transcriptional regulator [Vibrio ostreicida]|uniref:MerR family transcriptional regulator n=1 Tax=Vibrio ostreicida TaxID=526588 RepID=UPI00097149DF|nr:MerR family transcriptional regulator [Vibrio ostreicida]